MPALFLRQIIEQAPQIHIVRACRGSLIKTPALNFHRAGLFADSVEPQRTTQPHRFALDESFHVRAANHGDVVAILLLVEFHQARAMADLFLAHAIEHRC